MSQTQLWLFPHPKPLIERFGEAFFREIPKSPGVYLFCGPSEGVLYVGKAKNLHKRLGNYRTANPERHPRRVIRLLHYVTRIEWDECPTEAVASFREELLITVLQPRFNAAGKVWPLPDGNWRRHEEWLEQRRQLEIKYAQDIKPVESSPTLSDALSSTNYFALKPNPIAPTKAPVKI